MRRNSITVVVSAATLLALTPLFGQQPRQNPAAAPAPTAKAAPAAVAMTMERLLELWERQSSLLKSLDVKIKRLDKSDKWGDVNYEGRAILKSPNFAYLNFEKVSVENRQKKLVAEEQIRCTGSEVWQYKFPTKQIFIYPLDREQRMRALEEGPLPFLFNMKAAEAKARYNMRLLRETDTSYIIDVVPKIDIDQESFSKAFVQLDRKFLLPTHIYLIAPNGKDTRDFQLHEIKPQAAVNDQNFRGIVVKDPPGTPKEESWTVHRNPVGGGNRQDPAAKAAPQPALRNGVRPGRG